MVSIRLVVQPVMRVNESTWEAEIAPITLRHYFGIPEVEGIPINFLIARQVVERNIDRVIALELDPMQVSFKTCGENKRTIVVLVRGEGSSSAAPFISPTNLGGINNAIPQSNEEFSVTNQLSYLSHSNPEGDRSFLQELRCLPQPVAETGRELLTRVRAIYPQGELIYYSNSGKFVESPNNFWTVKIQPRACSLRITVWGKPHEHDAIVSKLDLKQDRARYSSFLLSSSAQIDESIQIIQNALKLQME